MIPDIDKDHGTVILKYKKDAIGVINGEGPAISQFAFQLVRPELWIEGVMSEELFSFNGQ
jgi:hypothetical protein